MGKIRTRIIGLEDVEEKQKKKAKERSKEKKEKQVIKEDKVEKETVKKEGKEILQEKVKKKGFVKGQKQDKGKKYKMAEKNVEKNKKYPISKAVTLLKSISYAKFDESFELHINVDKAGIKGEAELPHSIGKKIIVKIVDDKVLAEIENGQLNFDVLISHPSFMPKLAKYAKVLGPKGLMPNPKRGTVSTSPEEVVKKFERGVLQWKSESKFPLVHQVIGKVSSKDEEVVENAEAFIVSVGKSKIKKCFMKTTMSVALELLIE